MIQKSKREIQELAQESELFWELGYTGHSACFRFSKPNLLIKSHLYLNWTTLVTLYNIFYMNNEESTGTV